jgi:predicted glutamine amidotransferase
MCRLLGIVSVEPIPYRVLLREAPRSLSTLSVEHPDGWGIAVYSSQKNSESEIPKGWDLHKGTDCAKQDDKFHQLASEIAGEVLISHVRKKTVGPISIHNTHPFKQGNWVLAHNGTITDFDYLRENISKRRIEEIRGDTDSELFFAFLLSKLDAAELTNVPANEKTDALLKQITQEISARSHFGTLNFLFSDGIALYVFRLNQHPFFLLERGPHIEPSHIMKSKENGTIIETPWKKRRPAIFIASEKITNEAWQEIENGTLLRIDRLPKPQLKKI